MAFASQHFWFWRILTDYRGFPQLPIHIADILEIVNGFSLDIASVPFKSLFYHCVPEQASVLHGPSMTALPTAGFPVLPCLQISYPSLCGPSLIHCARDVQSLLGCSSGRTVLHVHACSLCSWQREFWVFYTAIFDSSLYCSFLRCVL